MKSRILVAVVGVPILLYIVLWGPPLLLLAALELLAGIGGSELYHCAGGKKDFLLDVAAVFIPVFTAGCYYVIPQYVGLWLVLSTIFVFGYGILRGGEVRFQQISVVLFGGIAIGYAFAAFLRIYASGIHRGYLLLPFILSFACDTFAYFAGISLGRHKLAPRVSPGKTVEGSIGGLVGNMVCGAIFAFVMNSWFDGSIHYGLMILVSLLCGVVAQIGDLSFSLIKREFGIKDYGHIFLAHGGVLDRFDSVLFVAPALAAVMQVLS